MIGSVITDEIRDDPAAVAIGVQRMPDESGRGVEKLRRAAVAGHDQHLIAVLRFP